MLDYTAYSGDTDDLIHALAMALLETADDIGEGAALFRHIIGSAITDIWPYRSRPLIKHDFGKDAAVLPYDEALRSAFAKTEAADAVWLAFAPLGTVERS